MEFFDSHSHYNDEKFDNDRDEMIKNIYENGVTKAVVVGYNAQTSKQAVEIANKYNFLYATCGISPNDIENFDEQLQEIEQLLKNKKIVAIGEIGLDYYWGKDKKEEQKEIFIKQIELANKYNLPIAIHSRDASSDTIDIIKNKAKCNKAGIFHCCQQNIEFIKEGIKLGYYVSFAGPITFKNSKNAEEIISKTPLERILIETDCPYLSPEPVRNTRNNSKNLIYIAQKIAKAKEITVEEVAKATYQNAMKIYGIQ